MRITRPIRLFATGLVTAIILVASLPLLLLAVAPDADTVWRDFSPDSNTWVTALPATSSITASDEDGLTVDAAYQYSPDAGQTWSGWLTANLQIGGDISTTRYITVAGLALGEGQNFIQYRITDTLGTASDSPPYLVNVDTIAPGSPIDPAPQPGGWTNVDDFGATWTNPSDVNGIGGVWHKLDATPNSPTDGVFEAGADITTLSGVAVGADGEHTLWLWLADGVGNADHGSAVPVTLRYDTQRPGALADLAVSPATWTNVNSFNLSWTAPADVSGISGTRQQLNTPPAAPDDGVFWPGAVDGFSHYAIPSDVDGEHRLWLWPVDGAGNSAATEDALPVILRLDMTPPAPPLAPPNVTPSGWQTETVASFTITWENPYDLSGIVGACYKLSTEEPVDDRDGVCVAGIDINQIEGVTPPAPGGYNVYLWLEDKTGNIDKDNRQVTPDAVQWDPDAPDIFIDPIGPVGLNDWYVGPIDVTIIASDQGSGLAAVEYNLDAAGWVEGRQLRIDEDGLHTLIARATDNAGNQTETDLDQLNLDSEAPTTALIIDQIPAFEDWYDEEVTVVFSPTDVTSGPDYVTWQLDDASPQQSNSAVISEDGVNTLQFAATDLAGNVEETQIAQIKVDRLPPVTSYVILPNDANNGWYTRPVTITLVPADDGAGVAETYYRIDGGEWQTGTEFSLEESGEYTVEFYSVDYLGHEETPYSIPDGVRIDTVAPWAPTPVDVEPKGWTNDNEFDLLLAVPPDLSGIAGAYFKVGAPPAHATDGEWRAGSSNVLHGVQVPAEGGFDAYVWLQDVAGNVDHTRYGVWEQALSLNYDATPPTTTVELAGTPGDNGWFLSPVTVTLTPTDTLSGVASTSVSIDGGPPTDDMAFTLSTPDKHTIRFQSVDGAGNEEPWRLETIRIDPDPPASPIAVETGPRGWTSVNSFSLVWTNPPDTSGIAAGYYKLGSPPANARDGVMVSPIGATSGITVPEEGAWDLHFWLMDRAGNADLDSTVILSDALRYDGAPPVTTATVESGELGANGWYTSAVAILLSAADGASGVDHLRYRLNGGEWVEVDDEALVTISDTGRYELEYQAFDVAGNVESLNKQSYKIDVTPPQPRFHSTDRYQRQTSFMLSWEAIDQIGGSGLDGFDLQVKDGRNGAWAPWGGINVPDTSGRYYGNYGHRYFFRMRARDVAGNSSRWVDLPWGVYIDPLLNGGFAGNSLVGWRHGGVLPQAAIDAPGPEGDETSVAQLGSPDFGPNVPGNDIPADSPGTVPVGAGFVEQEGVLVPGLDVLDTPTITLWYRVLTYDVQYSSKREKWFDTFDIVLTGPTGEQLAWRDGLPEEQWVRGELADLGWQYASIQLPPSWPGSPMTISIQNWNRVDGRYNTWTEVSDVRLWEPYRTYLPQVIGSGQMAATAQLAEPDRHAHRPADSLR